MSVGSFLAPGRAERQAFGPEARALDASANVWAQAFLAERGLYGRCQTGTDYDSFCLAAARVEALKRIAAVTAQPDPNGATPLHGDWQTQVALAREVVARLNLSAVEFDAAPYAAGGPFTLQSARVSVFPDTNANAPEDWTRTWTVAAGPEGQPVVPPSITTQLRAMGECQRELDRWRETNRAQQGFAAPDETAGIAAYVECLAPIMAALPPDGAVMLDTAAAEAEWSRREPVEIPPEREVRTEPVRQYPPEAYEHRDMRESPPQQLPPREVPPGQAVAAERRGMGSLVWLGIGVGAVVVLRVAFGRRGR